jgi:Arc/MetJ-type ribon-helix-helix transcriptional regulator
MQETTLTLKFRGLEAELLEEMVRLGLFNSKSEAIRAAIMKYAVDSGLLNRADLWNRVKAYKRRGVSPDELERDLQSLEEH